MTEIRELRAKNWVMRKGRPYEECDGDMGKFREDEPIQIDNSISADGELCWNDNGTFHCESISEFYPIPFTTEWAERFHLIGSVINGFCIAPSEHKGNDYDLCLYDEHTWDSERKVLCPINSVHHCQNLFLDLANHILE